jgi:serine phosphatase RsbU (regulator of sigma subunit)
LYQPQPVKVKLKLISRVSQEYMSAGLMDSARYWLSIGLHLADSIHDEKKMAALHMNMGNSYMQQGMFPKALDHYLKNVAVREKLKDSLSLANSYNSIGIVYFRMNEQEKAFDYWKKSLRLSLRFNKQDLAMNAYTNMAMLYNERNDTIMAMDYTLKGLDIARSMKDSSKIATIAANVGELYNGRKQYKKGLEYLDMAVAYGANEANGGRGSPELDGCYAYAYAHLKQYPLAHQHMDKALALAHEMKDNFLLEQLYQQDAEMYADEKNFPEAFKAQKLFAQFNDSVYSKKNVEKMSDLRAQYEVDKKESELKQEEHVQELNREVEARKQKLFDLALMAGLAMVAILALILFRGYRIKKKSNQLILEQKREIEGKNQELEQVNKEVHDSIQYAQRIQQAILPPLELIQENLPESFVFYRPKNVVSGDFYFFSKGKKGELLFAVCDCTGHGVPGAFMSMIGSEQLSKIINERQVMDPAVILNELHAGMRHALQQDRNTTRDGMDAALCRIDRKTNKLFFAGANRPCWIITAASKELVELKPDKQAIGGLEAEQRKLFGQQEYQLHAGDKVYLFSDGYADQFGGERGKKFMLRSFQKLLLSVTSLSMKEQEAALNLAFSDWKGNLEQVDDILVVGFEI